MRKKFFHAHARTCTRIYADLYKTRLQGQNGYKPSALYISTVLADGLLQDVTKPWLREEKRRNETLWGPILKDMEDEA